MLAPAVKQGLNIDIVPVEKVNAVPPVPLLMAKALALEETPEGVMFIFAPLNVIAAPFVAENRSRFKVPAVNVPFAELPSNANNPVPDPVPIFTTPLVSTIIVPLKVKL